MNIAENIRKYREQAGMLQSELGKHLGVSAQAVSKWELGKAEPDCTCILKMCSLFGISADDLLGAEVSRQFKQEAVEQAFMNDLTEEERNQVLSYAEFLRSSRK